MPAGTFSCFKVQWLIDLNGNGAFDDNVELHDFIADQGLIRRSILMRDLVITSEDSPDSFGLYDFREDLRLTSVTLK